MWRRASLYIYALVAVIYLTLPFAWVAAVSFMPEREVTQQHWWPEEPTIGNYSLYFDVEGQSADVGAAIARQFPRAIVNSLIIGSAVMLLNLTCGSLAAYALSRLPFRGNLLLLLFYLGSRSVPGVAIMIPMYLLMRSYGLLDTHLSVILSHTTFTLPFTIWILKGYFQTVPLDLERAARVDGCTPLGALLRVFLPVTTPGLVAVGIFAFIASWGEFLFALLFTTTIASRPVTVLASDFAQELQVPFTVIAAGGVLVILLPLVLSFLFQRLIIQGIGGSVTG
ncbi:MAG: carbohydrate ABC transporter permease [Gemmatimonadetes bacterium]|nr:carbohydrate ABC transporter permease [Gemmatimonadota bacterium]MYH19188.1 carbohydrate ABC transporter permease [Gemmatimonadota bacterium]MYK98831.1 carbohydrate ABC transporter permease [Gemmatimonadota bacterium]